VKSGNKDSNQNQNQNQNENQNQKQESSSPSKELTAKKKRKNLKRAEKAKAKERAVVRVASADAGTTATTTTTTTTLTTPATPPVEIPHWMQRTNMLLGPDNVRKLITANVIVVGLGGVGGIAAEMVARAGIGRMTIIDNDIVDITNCNRQIVALHSTEGKNKAQVLAQRLREINPKIELTVLETYIADGKAQELLKAQKYDFAMDCIDTLSSKCWYIRSCIEAGVPVASSMGAGGKVDPSLIRSGDLSDVNTCKFGQAVRKRLHKWGIKDGIPVVYSEETIDATKLIHTPNTLKKTTIGTISYMPAIFGCTLASLVIRRLYERAD